MPLGMSVRCDIFLPKRSSMYVFDHVDAICQMAVLQ
jgi:hypothetical protein